MNYRIGFAGAQFALKRSALLIAVILCSFGLVSIIIPSLKSTSDATLSVKPTVVAVEQNYSKEFIPAYDRLDDDTTNESSVIDFDSLLLEDRSKSVTTRNDQVAYLLMNGKSASVLQSTLEHSDDSNQEPLCAVRPAGLTGMMKQSVLLIPTLKEGDILGAHKDLKPGGSWQPFGCRARHKIAVIIPFRDRRSHLNRLLDYLIPMLQRQQLDFRFIVTEQYGHDLFNKGRIMNAAFQVAEQLGVECVIFHDVDLFPQGDRNMYSCPDDPLHLGAFVNTLGYELWYNYIAGGVLAMRMEHYRTVNGYSNLFWAWGGEDDDMGKRILANNYTLARPDNQFSRYTMLKHIKRTRTAPKLIHSLLRESDTRWSSDGLNNTQWKIVKILRKPLYYHIFVDVGVPPAEWRQQ